VTSQRHSFEKCRSAHLRITTATSVFAWVLLLGLQGCGGGNSGNPPTPILTPTFTTIDAPGAGTQGFQGTYPASINSNGDIAGLLYDSHDASHAFLRSAAGVLTVFDAPGAAAGINQGSTAFGINSSGTIVGSFFDVQFISHGYIRAPDGTFTPIDFPGNFPMTLSTIPTSLNDKGMVAGQFIDGSQVHGFVYSPGSVVGPFRAFDPPGSNAGSSVRGFGCGINAGGAITGSFLDNNLLWHSFLRAPDGTFTTIDAPGEGTIANTGTVLGSMNTNGAIVGTVYETAAIHSFLRAPDGTFTIFDPLGTGSKGSVGADINDSGAIVGSYTDSNLVRHGYIRTPDGTFTAIDDPNASQAPNSLGTTVTHINAGGAIVGEFFDATGVRHGYVRK
jgi:uncharacterized membrane protein